MQDIQNIPNPDVDSTKRDDDFGSHPEPEEIEKAPAEDIPVPPDEPPPAPVEEPPGSGGPPVGEDQQEPKRIV